MRIRRITLELDTEDINSIISDFLPEHQLQVTGIDADGIRGHLRFLLWNIDFIARPYSRSSDELNIDVTARKLVTIPPSIIQRQLREAMKDAPPGIDVMQQMLRVKFTSLLAPFGLSLKVEELQSLDGFVRVTLSGIHAFNVGLWFQGNQGGAPVCDDEERTNESFFNKAAMKR